MKSKFMPAVLVIIFIFVIFFLFVIGLRFRPQILRFFSIRDGASMDEKALAENELLKARLQELENGPVVLEYFSNSGLSMYSMPKPGRFLAVDIYLNYPFNQRNLFLVNAGANFGVKEKMAVVSGGNLIGFVEKVSATDSLIKTFWDSSISLKVLVKSKDGDKNPALLSGGPKPILTLAEKAIDIGDEVVSADSRLPFGWKLGVVNEKISDSASVYTSATVGLNNEFLKTNKFLIYLDYLPSLRSTTGGTTGEALPE